MTDPLVTVEGLHLHRSNSHRAVYVSVSGDPEQGVWLATASIIMEEIGPNRVTIMMPQGLAEERGLPCKR